MSTEFVKSGFKYVIPELLKEFEFHGICKDSHLSTNANFDNDVVRLLMSVVNKREENAINAQIEHNKKQQAPQKSQQTFRPNQLILVSLYIAIILLSPEYLKCGYGFCSEENCDQ